MGEQNLVNSDCLSGGGGQDTWQNLPSHPHACRPNAVVKDQAGPGASFKCERRPCHRCRGSASGPWELGREHTAGGRPVLPKTHISTWDQVADCLVTQWNKTKGGQDRRGSGNSPSKTAWKKWLYHYSVVWKNKSSSELG